MQGRTRLLAAVTTAATLGLSAPAMADTAYGLLGSGTDLTTFDTDAPNQRSTAQAITGLDAGEKVAGIDVRPANGVLYGLGVNGTKGRLLKIDPTTGAATSVGVLKDGATGGADIVLSGAQFDIDFNPGADRLRIVSDANQNLRVNPANGVVAQLAMGTPGDGNLNPGDPDVGHTAYNNSFSGTTATTQYAIDAATDTFNTVASNPGTLTAVGPLGQDVSNVGGLDIAAGTNEVVALVNVTGGTTAGQRFGTIDASTGALTVTSGAVAGTLIDFALAPRDVQTFLGLATPDTGGQQLFTFRSDKPETTLSTVAVSGLVAGDTLVGIDTRPRTGQVYGVGSPSKTVYVIEPASGVATAVPNGVLSSPLTGTRFGVDFNPAADRLRIVSDEEQNLRVNLANPSATGADGTTVDGTLPTGNIVETAYTKNQADTASTEIFYLDSGSDKLLTTTTPNTPNPTTEVGAAAGNLGIDVTDRGGFDIAGPFDHKFAALATEATPGTYGLYSIGAATTLPGSSASHAVQTGTLAPPAGTKVDAITALVKDTVSVADTSLSVAENGGSVKVTLVREGDAASAATVSFVTGGGTATADVDYTKVEAATVFAPGERVRSVTVPIVDDKLVEGTETFGFAITGVTGGARIGAQALTAVSILDDEVPASVGTGPAATVLVPVAVPSTTPFVFVRAATDEIRISTLRSKGFLLRLYCTQACEVSGNLTAATALAKRTGKNIATIKATKLTPGAVKLVRVKLTAKAKKALGAKSQKSATFKLPLKVKDPSGKTTNVAALTVKANR